MVSIIVPCHNYGRYLVKCLKSIQNQTKKTDEIIVVDDKSDDNTDQIVKRFRVVKYFRVNFGQANKSRNFGFAKSKGDYVMFFDADDFMRKDCIEKLFKALQKDKKAGFAYSDRIDLAIKNEKIVKKERVNSRKWDFQRLQEENYISMPGLIRRKYFVGFDENLHRCQDWDLWLSIGKKIKGIYLTQPLFYRRRHSSSISSPSAIGIISALNFLKADRKVREKHKLQPISAIKAWQIKLNGLKATILGE